MPTALHPAEPSSHPHQGIGARLVRGFGSAVRSAFAGISRAGSRRRPIAPAPGLDMPAPRRSATPTPPRRSRAPRRPLAGPPSSPSRAGWFARWFGLGPRHTRSFLDPGDGPFTPDSHPGLGPEACAILNMPVEECPPEILRILLTGLAQHIADNLPPELGLTDPEALFSTLWSRLAGAPDEAPPDAAPAEQPGEAPAEAMVIPPDALPETPAPNATENAATPAIAASPAASALTLPRADRRRRSLRRACRALPRRGLADQRVLPPPRRIYYAACAGPP